MSKFLDNLNNAHLYDTNMLHRELSELQRIDKEGTALIKSYILDSKLNAHQIEFGILNQEFFIQVIVKTFTYKSAIETDCIKFTYPIKNSKLKFNTDLDKKIFDFYKIKTYQFLNNMLISY